MNSHFRLNMGKYLVCISLFKVFPATVFYFNTINYILNIILCLNDLCLVFISKSVKEMEFLL